MKVTIKVSADNVKLDTFRNDISYFSGPFEVDIAETSTSYGEDTTVFLNYGGGKNEIIIRSKYYRRRIYADDLEVVGVVE